MRTGVFTSIALWLCVVAGSWAFHADASPVQDRQSGGQWDAKKAAAYLDARESWWSSWSGAKRDHGTFCVSCHTALPYALARPELAHRLGETLPSVQEQKLLDDVKKRVRLSQITQPYYGTESGYNRADQSRGTEAVLNALILASFDRRIHTVTPETTLAFNNMWRLQNASGAGRGSWTWLNFGNEPWEANDSPYYGACLAAFAAGLTPRSYRADPSLHEKLEALRQFLVRDFERQSVVNRVLLLRASVYWPELLSRAQQQKIMSDVLDYQRPDGAWSMSSIAWTTRTWTARSLMKLFRSYATPIVPHSDGYATGLVALTLQE